MDQNADPIETYRWFVPVPWKQSSFLFCRSEMAPFNLEVDLAAIAAYGVPTGGAEPLLYCDLQANHIGNAAGRFGAGRSAYFMGHCLKGVGRTLLAGNWRDLDDIYHNSGHLTATSATREFLITAYLQGMGVGESILPCEGVLARPLDTRLIDWPESVGVTEPFACDRHLQTLSVKRGFAVRFSNVIWLLLHPADPPDAVGFDFLKTLNTLARCLGVSGSAAQLVQALCDVAEQAWQHFCNFNRVGLFWGSYHNNFAIDGRFIDLECPLLFGRPYLGLLQTDGAPVRAPFSPMSRYYWVGFEYFHYLTELKHFIALLQRRIQAYRRPAMMAHPALKPFLDELEHCLQERFSREGGLFDRHLIKRRYAEMHRSFNLSPKARQGAQMVCDYLLDILLGEPQGAAELVLTRDPIGVFQAEYGQALYASSMDGTFAPGERALAFHCALDEAACYWDPLAYLQYLEQSAISFRREDADPG